MKPSQKESDNTALTPVTSNARWAIWLLIAATACLTYFAYDATGTMLVPGDSGLLGAAIFAMLAIINRIYTVIRPDPWISLGSEYAAQILAIAVLFVLLDCAVAVGGNHEPYRDSFLEMCDRTLRFDWRGYVSYFDGRPSFQMIAKICYLSIFIYYPLIPFALVVRRDFRRAECFIIALWTILMITTAVFFYMPATGAYAYFGVSLHELRTLHPIFLTNGFLPLLTELREHRSHAVHLDALEGLITFPSFHAAAAVLFTWALWPSRWLRWPTLAINSMMIVAAPVEGAHYITDICAGISVAIFAILAAAFSTRRYMTGAPSIEAADSDDTVGA